MSDESPLYDVDVGVPAAPTPPVRLAARVLAGLGANTHQARLAPAELVVSSRGGIPIRAAVRGDFTEAAGLPSGATDYAVGLCLVTAAASSLLVAAEHEVDPMAVVDQLLLALPGPIPEPVEAGDGGWLWCDFAPGERDVFAELLDGRPAAAWDAAELAAAAQAVGLAVVDIRPRSAWPERLAPARILPLDRVERSCRTSGSAGPALAGMRVCDLTAMWSGPLATRLLASLGADVYKIEPDCRLDGTRASPAVFEALNRGKRRLNLDLRDAQQHKVFLREVLECDLVVSNFTPRVQANLAIEPSDLVPGRDRPLTCLQMPAFPEGVPERHWRAYGNAIHGVSGLGLTAGGEPWMATSPYCDALSGFAAAAIAVVLRVATASGRNWMAEVPMLNVAAQVAQLAPPPPTRPISVTRRERSGPPRSPFHGPGLPVPNVPAPALAMAPGPT